MAREDVCWLLGLRAFGGEVELFDVSRRAGRSRRTIVKQPAQKNGPGGSPALAIGIGPERIWPQRWHSLYIVLAAMGRSLLGIRAPRVYRSPIPREHAATPAARRAELVEVIEGLARACGDAGQG